MTVIANRIIVIASSISLLFVLAAVLFGIKTAAAQDADMGVVICTPMQKTPVTGRTQIECRLETASSEVFVVSELTFPFKIISLLNTSSKYSATVGTHYTAAPENTVSITSLNLGAPDFEAASFDSLNLLVETDQTISAISGNIKAQSSAVISYLSPTDTGVEFKTATVEFRLQLDTSFFIEAFTKAAEKVGVLQFLKLGKACYNEKSEDCIQNLMNGL